MKYLKKEFDSYNLHMVKTNKFKSTFVEIIFGNHIKKEEITISNFLSNILTYNSKKYNTKVKYTKKMEDLYAASIYSNSYRVGNIINVDFNLRVLDDKYTENGLFEEAIDFLYETLFNPNVSNNEFDLDSFNVVKNNEKSQIERVKENQKVYSIIKLLNLFDENSPMSFNPKGYISDLEKITRANLYEFYKKFIKESSIDIFVVGDIDFDYVSNVIFNKFKFENKIIKQEDFIVKYKKHRKKRQEEYEKNNTNQSRLSICCTLEDMTKFERDYVLNLYNLILGGTADSKFFKNIREKYSLCYYAVSGANKLDNILTISSGITKENYSKMLILIEKEMKDMRNGKFSDEDLEKAKKYYLSSLEEIEDNPGQIIASFYAVDKLGVDSIDKRKKEIEKVTKEDITTLANKVFIDTIFLLGGDKNGKK